MTALAVVLGMEDGLVLDHGTPIVAGSAGLALHDILHGELVVADLAFALENLVIVAVLAGRAGIEMELVAEDRVSEFLPVLLHLEDDVSPMLFFLRAGLAVSGGRGVQGQESGSQRKGE